MSNVVLYGGRLLLAYNRLLFPCPKQLLSTVAACADKPEGFARRTEALLRQPSPDTLAEYLAMITSFADWGVPDAEVLTVFLELDEWSWLDNEPALAQR